MVYEIKTKESWDDLLCAIESILAYDGRFLDSRETTKKMVKYGVSEFDIQATVRLYLAKERHYQSMSMDEFLGMDMSKTQNRQAMWEHITKHVALGKHALMQAYYNGHPTVFAILSYDRTKEQVLVNCPHRGLVYLKRDDLMHDLYNGDEKWFGENLVYVWR